MKVAVYIFRRDLRIIDNRALYAAHQSGMHVMPCFIVDPKQVSSTNAYRSCNALQFMADSLSELAQAMQADGGTLYLWYGAPTVVLKKLILHKKIHAVYLNGDYTPFSRARDAALQALCAQHKIPFYAYHDYLLNDPDTIVTTAGTPYTVFTPFYRRASQELVPDSQRTKARHWYTGSAPDGCISIEKARDHIVGTYQNELIAVHGGRAEGLHLLRKLTEQKQYVQTRDICAEHTTKLSAHLKFGTLSVREVYHAIVDALGSGHPLLRQLYWRDFWTYIAYHMPSVLGHAYHVQYDALPWQNDKKLFELWCTGNTGFPIVDAGMRELNSTGYMHNRVRMIVGSFLTKDLHIDWRWGEKYFAQQLVDYDPAVNNGNWQWVASTGCDGQPYFRIFNPWLQQKKFDPECVYIHRWVPELRKYTPQQIHAQYKKPLPGYAEPCIDHAVEAAMTKKVYAAYVKKKRRH